MNSDKRTAELAVLFADISGSTRLYDTLGDTRAKTLVDECIALMRGIVGRYSGRVIKTIGDEVMCTLPDVERTLFAASEMQSKIAALPAVDGTQLAIRVGFHFGPVIEEGNDVFGDTVNVAARMAALAKPAQIITTRATVDRLPRALRETTRPIAALSVKGKGDDVEVCEVIWEEGEDLTMTVAAGAVPSARTTLRLNWSAGELVLGDADTFISLGRDAACGVVLADRKASRVHARIERRRDKFFLIDESTNGTFVTFAGEAEIVLRREEAILRGSGSITFGHSAAETGGEVVRFALR